MLVIRVPVSQAGLRVELDAGSGRMNSKIRQAQEQKIPYMRIIGDREVAEGTVAVGGHQDKATGVMTVAAFIAQAKEVMAQYG